MSSSNNHYILIHYIAYKYLLSWAKFEPKKAQGEGSESQTTYLIINNSLMSFSNSLIKGNVKNGQKMTNLKLFFGSLVCFICDFYFEEI